MQRNNLKCYVPKNRENDFISEKKKAKFQDLKKPKHAGPACNHNTKFSMEYMYVVVQVISLYSSISTKNL